MSAAAAARPGSGWPAAGARAALAVALLAALVTGCGAPADEQAVEAEPAMPTDGVYGRVAPAVGGVPSVVLLEAEGIEAAGAGPAVAGDVRGAADALPRIDQLGLQFSPRFLVVRVGEPMVFTNSESLAHNVMVHAVAGGAPLLSEDTPPGGRVSFTFDEAGAYDVACEIHPGMTGLVYATDAPFAAFAEPDGSFEIGGVPPGEYTLRVWSVEPSRRAERAVTVAPGQATEVVASDGDH